MTINIEYRDTRMKRLHCRVFGHDPRKLETIHVCRRCHQIINEQKKYMQQFLRKLFLIKYKLKYRFYKIIRLKIDCMGRRTWLWFKWIPKNTSAYQMK